MLDRVCERCGRFNFESPWSCKCVNLLRKEKVSMVGIGGEGGGEESGDYKAMYDENPERGRRVKFGQ